MDELRRGPLASGPVLVALSGGLDSCVLLHALRFGPGDGVELVAAHFDHAMRPGSAADAAWVRGLCRAWGVPLRAGRAERAPTSEDEARSLRYAFIERSRDEVGAGAVATAHHADDQAETVLFRVLRGTGIGGLRGIPARREPAVIRPLLDIWREELEAYATAHLVGWREDPTNDQLGYARNLIRHELLPLAERGVSSGARRALVRLADVADANEEAWREVMPDVLRRLDVAAGVGAGEDSSRELSIDRVALAVLGEPLRARVLRMLAAELGWSLDRSSTRRAVAFVAEAAGGKRIELGGGVELRREAGRIVMSGPVEGLRRTRAVAETKGTIHA